MVFKQKSKIPLMHFECMQHFANLMLETGFKVRFVEFWILSMRKKHRHDNLGISYKFHMNFCVNFFCYVSWCKTFFYTWPMHMNFRDFPISQLFLKLFGVYRFFFVNYVKAWVNRKKPKTRQNERFLNTVVSWEIVLICSDNAFISVLQSN